MCDYIAGCKPLQLVGSLVLHCQPLVPGAKSFLEAGLPMATSLDAANGGATAATVALDPRDHFTAKKYHPALQEAALAWVKECAVFILTDPKVAAWVPLAAASIHAGGVAQPAAVPTAFGISGAERDAKAARLDLFLRLMDAEPHVYSKDN